MLGFEGNGRNKENNKHWNEYIEERTELYKRRSEGERPFADQKHNHGLGRAKYLGLNKFKMQSWLTATVYNLKRGVKLLFDVSLSLA